MPDDDEVTTYRIESARSDGLSLWIVSEEGTAEVPLETACVVIGRGRDCDIRIDDGSVSRRHAEIDLRARDHGLKIRDLGSANGVRVGATRVGAEWARLEVGHLIELGAVRMSVRGATGSRPRAWDPAGGIPEHIVAIDPVSVRALELAHRVAPSPLSVLIVGETGAGKEIVAAEIHRASGRGGKMVAINCAAIAPQLLESELFGHVRGAFSGADRDRVGLLEHAQRGTVFLDEIGELELELQAKLLRAIETRSVLPVGGRDPRQIDVRFVSATHRDLTAGERFRRDLFFRLAGLTIEVPPLRARPKDRVALAERFAAAHGLALSSSARAALDARSWPGNVRELKHAIDRGALLATGGVLELDDGSPAALASAPAGDEKARIERALVETAGNQTRAAELLGISRRTLVNRLNRYGIARPRKKSDG